MRGKVARELRNFVYGGEFSYRHREHKGRLMAQTVMAFGNTLIGPTVRKLDKVFDKDAHVARAEDYADRLDVAKFESAVLIPSITVLSNMRRRMYQHLKRAHVHGIAAGYHGHIVGK